MGYWGWAVIAAIDCWALVMGPVLVVWGWTDPKMADLTQLGEMLLIGGLVVWILGTRAMKAG